MPLTFKASPVVSHRPHHRNSILFIPSPRPSAPYYDHLAFSVCLNLGLSDKWNGALLRLSQRPKYAHGA